MIRSGIFLLAAVVLLSGCDRGVPGGVELGQADCSPVGTECRLSSPDGSIALQFEDGVSPLKAFPVAVSTSLPAEAVTVSFEMVGMDMGPNRNRLERGATGWQGRAVLPVCVTGRADWVATVEVQDGEGGRYRARFPFVTD